MVGRGTWLAAGPLVGVACALLALFAAGAGAEQQERSPIVELERWLVSEDGHVRRVTVIVDTRVADPERVLRERYPAAVEAQAVAAQFVTFARWDASDIPVPVLYDDDYDPPGIGGRPQLMTAMSTWNAVSQQSFRFSDAGVTSEYAPTCDLNQGDGANTMRFSALLPDGVLGETCTFFAYDGFSDMERIVEFDMHLDGASTEWSTAPQTPNNRFDLLSVVLHELGHAFGLDHSVDGTLMQEFLGEGQQIRMPTSDDIAGMRALYGTPSTPSPTPSPTATATATASPTPTQTPTPTPDPGDRPYRASMGAVARD